MGQLFVQLHKGPILFTANQSMALYKFRMGAMQALTRHGYEVIALAPTDVYSEKIRQAGIRFIPMDMAIHEANPVKDIVLFWKLLRLYKKLRPSLIFHFTIKPNIYGTLAAKIAGSIPSVSVVPGRGFTFQKKNWLSRLVRWMCRISLRYAKETWFLNEEDRQFFIAEGLVKPDATCVLPGEGVDTRHYSRSESAAPKKEDGFTFLFAGRLMWEKGVGVFVEAARMVCRQHPAARFQLLGFLDPTDSRVVPQTILQQWVEEGIIEFLGETMDVRPFFQQADCFVLPSFYGEGVPRTLLEAASMELPIITTNHRGCNRTLVDGISGFLCTPNDAGSLAEKMKAMLALSPLERFSMGQQGRNLAVTVFDEGILASHYIECVGRYISEIPAPFPVYKIANVLPAFHTEKKTALTGVSVESA